MGKLLRTATAEMNLMAAGPSHMSDGAATELELEARLARCCDLAREFPDGSIAAMIRDMVDDLREQIRLLEK